MRKLTLDTLRTRTTGTLTQGKVIDLFTAGKKTDEIAKLAGVTRERIRYILRRHGLQKQKTRKKKVARVQNRTEIKRLRVEAIAKVWGEGKLAKEIAAIFGLSPATVPSLITRLRRRHPELFPHRKCVRMGMGGDNFGG